MAIEFRCSCGALCSADQAQAGQLYHCDACGLDIPVPAPASAGASVAPLEDMAGQVEDKAAHDAAVADMVSQVQAATAAGGQPARPKVDIEDLRREVAGQMPLSDAEAAKREADRAEFQRQLGQRAGADELIYQITGRRPSAESETQGTSAPPRPPAGTFPAAAPSAVAAARKPAGLAAPPRGAARAAHHIGFKRAMKAPAIIIGLICAIVGAYCLIPHFHSVAAPRLPDELKARYGDNPSIQYDGQGHAWFAPQGSKLSVSATGKVFYLNEAGYEEPADSADDWVKATQGAASQASTYWWYGIGFAIVGVALVALGLWMWIDVRLVHYESLPVAEEVSPGSAAAVESSSAPSPAATGGPAGGSAESSPAGSSATAGSADASGPAGGPSAPTQPPSQL